MLEKRKTVFTYIRYNVDQIQNIFYPIRHDQDCMILELKVDHKPEEAIAQIKEKEYALRFKGKTAERKEYTGRILAVGISYNSKTKEHECKIEQL